MKSIKKFIFIMAALAAVLAFVSCSNGDDGGSSNNNNNSSNSGSNNNASDNSNDNNGNSGNSNTIAKPSVIATYESVEDDKVLTFLSDGTWSVTGYDGSTKVTFSTGKYNGHPESNGRFEVSCIKYYDERYQAYKDSENPNFWEDVKVKDGMLSFDYAWNDYYIDFKRK